MGWSEMFNALSRTWNKIRILNKQLLGWFQKLNDSKLEVVEEKGAVFLKVPSVYRDLRKLQHHAIQMYRRMDVCGPVTLL
jgi:hypothetical protein